MFLVSSLRFRNANRYILPLCPESLETHCRHINRTNRFSNHLGSRFQVNYRIDIPVKRKRQPGRILRRIDDVEMEGTVVVERTDYQRRLNAAECLKRLRRQCAEGSGELG